jgi:hypothetical protein
LVAGSAIVLSGTAQAVPPAQDSVLGDSVTIGCTLPFGLNGSRVFSIDFENSQGRDINIPVALGDTCSTALNQLTPKTVSQLLDNRLITNCGVGIVGQRPGVWQSAGQTASNPWFPSFNSNAVGVVLASQLAPPGPAQPVLLAPPEGTYALVSYTFVCALPTGGLSYLLINQVPAP